MAKKRKERTYFNRACWKPHQLQLLKTLAEYGRDFDSTGKVIGYTQAQHRINPSGNRFCVPCEYICGRIGSFIGLPIPPFAITDAGDKGMCFSSLDFNFNRDKLPPILPDTCMKFMAGVCAGVLAFDILIANEDRHDQNLLVDLRSHPREMYVFDHDQALLGGLAAKGIPRLVKLWDHLGITGKDDVGGCRHVLLDELTNPDLMIEWTKRIEDIPEWFIRDACDFAAKELGITRDEADMARGFLVSRKGRIMDLVCKFRDEFRAVKCWYWHGGLFK